MTSKSSTPAACRTAAAADRPRPRTSEGRPSRGLAGADQAQRRILQCALDDACREHERAFFSCPDCLVIWTQREDGACGAHRAAETLFAEWTGLYVALDYEAGRAPAGLDREARGPLAAAVAAAITYRQDRPAAEDAALLAAYRELARQLG